MDSPFDRRAFLAGLGRSGAALLATSALSRMGYAAAAAGPARAVLQAGRVRATCKAHLTQARPAP